MKLLFVSPVVLNSRGWAYPLIDDVRNDATGTFPCVWTIPSFRDARRVAVGLCDVTEAQAAVLADNTRIGTVLISDGEIVWRDLETTRRNGFSNVAAEAGLDTSAITGSAKVTNIVTSLCGLLRGGRTAAHLERELALQVDAAPR